MAMVHNDAGSDRHWLAALERVSDGAALTDRIFGLVSHSQFFAEFTREDVVQLAAYMQIYRAAPDQTLIGEGDRGDHMLLIIEGAVDIYKDNSRGEQQHMTSAGPGMTLGEMSMIDGEPRFASCIAVAPTTVGVLTRDTMGRIIVEQPALGAKILVRLVTMLSQRLRQTSAKLLQYMS